jgi:hypothetical protein
MSTLEFNPLDYPIAMSELRYFSGDSAWTGHIPFGMAVVQMTRPRTLVELGTHWGDSYCAFCQAVATLNLPTRCAAVDTWKGDHQSGVYSERVYDRLSKFHDPTYGAFSKLMRMTFDEALTHFPDNSIDLLHIDGLHTYEAVRHDYDTWKAKLSERGVVLFHDTMVRHGDFGVWQLWEELRNHHPSFQFEHESGLGVLAVGNEPPGELIKFLEFAQREATLVRQYFMALGGRFTLLTALQRTVVPLRAAQVQVNQWRSRTGRPLKRGSDNPYQIAQITYNDVQELLAQLK